MKFTMKKILGGIALAASLLSSAQAVPLSALLNGGSITAGDKLFDQWSLMRYETSNPARSFSAANIDVTALSDGGLDPGPGLRFDVLPGELSVTGDDIYAFVDLMFGFRVTVLEPGLAIKDNSLLFGSGGAFLAYASADGDWDLGSYIHETVGTAAGLDDLGIKHIEFSTLAVPGAAPFDVSKTIDVASFAPQQQIWVTKNVLVWARDVTDSAGIFAFEQRFSQAPIPEPASVALAGVALLGLIGVRRRARR